MDPIAGVAGSLAGVPLGVFLSHTSDLGQPKESESFVAAAIGALLRARHAVIDMAYFAARDTSSAATCVEMVAQSDVYIGIIGLRYGSPVRDRPDVSYTELPSGLNAAGAPTGTPPVPGGSPAATWPTWPAGSSSWPEQAPDATILPT
jgi:hypothetical protein